MTNQSNPQTLLLLFVTTVLIVFTSCKKVEPEEDIFEDFPELELDDDKYYKVSGNGFNCVIDTSLVDVYSYDKVRPKTKSKQYDDFYIIDADTTLIAIYADFLENIGEHPIEGEIAIFHFSPFSVLNARITDVQNAYDEENEALYYILNIEKVGLDEVFAALDADLDDSDYVDTEKANSFATKAALTFQDQMEMRTLPFLDNEGKLHPAIVGYEDENGEIVVVDQLSPTKLDVWVGLNIPKLNFSINPTFNDKIEIGIEDGKLVLGAGVGINLKIRWFKLKYFEAYAKAEADIKIPFYIKAEASGDLVNIQKELAGKNFYKVFFISVVPVVVNIRPHLDLVTKVSMNASAKFETGFEFSALEKVGKRWESGSWRDIREHREPHFQWYTPKLTGQVSLKGSVGVYPTVSAGIYGINILKGYLDPKLVAEVGLKTENLSTLSMFANGKFEVGAGVGAQLKIFKWTVAEASMSWPIYSKDIFSTTIDIKK